MSRPGYMLYVNEVNAVVEIFPILDSEEHDWGAFCHCNPQIIHHETGGTTISHWPQDGRHVVEQALGIINNQ